MPIDKQTTERIFSMYRQNYQIKTIEKVTGVSHASIRALVKSSGVLRSTDFFYPGKVTPNKYDYLLDEPVAQGKMYANYIKENK